MLRLFFYVLAPPTIFIFLSLAGAVMALRYRWPGMLICLASGLCLWAAATPAVSSYLLHYVEAALPNDVDFSRAQAIVVLGGDVRNGDGAAIADALGPLSLERVVLAAAAARKLRLPIAMTGDGAANGHASEAALMKVVMEEQFGIPVRWSEEQSSTTWENAVFTAALLRPEKIETVVLVSQAWHLPRALWAFERAGLTALPWPASRTVRRYKGIGDFFPSAGAFHDTFHAVHEILGSALYRWRY